jgi:hypothetical protein
MEAGACDVSTKPADIPQDVYDTARRRYFDHVNAQGQITPAPTEDELIEVAARCILGERERCAGVAVGLQWNPGPNTRPESVPAIRAIVTDWGAKIAAAIRGDAE